MALIGEIKRISKQDRRRGVPLSGNASRLACRRNESYLKYDEFRESSYSRNSLIAAQMIFEMGSNKNGREALLPFTIQPDDQKGGALDLLIKKIKFGVLVTLRA